MTALLPSESIDAPATPPAEWSAVHPIVGPLADTTDVDALYVQGGSTGAVRVTPTGRRRDLVVLQGTRATFGTYFNAFPAAYWRHWVGTRTVRLRLGVDQPAILTVYRSNASGAATAVDGRLLARGEIVTVDVDISGTAEGGMVWFDLRAAARTVRVIEAAWLVADAPVVDGSLVLGMPTMGRASEVAFNLGRVRAAAALTKIVDRIVIVDHGEDALEADPEVAGAARRLHRRVRIVRQQNLGGSGGFSRVMHEAVAEAGAAFVLLLDDDIAVEPVALLRAFEFGRRTAHPAIVGLQMLDLDRPTELVAAAERVERDTFWWGPTDAALAGANLGDAPITVLSGMHVRQRADYAGWWACLVPLTTVRRIGYAAPLFLKWDDAEFGLRAGDAGVPTVSLPGAAVWHESWRTKDDTRAWPAFFHARNRFVAALLHGDPEQRLGLLKASLLLDLKQLLGMQYFAVERRHDGLRELFDGPAALGQTLRDTLPNLRELAAVAADQHRHAPTEVPSAPDAPITRSAPESAPGGMRFVGWAGAMIARHWLSGSPDADAVSTTRLSIPRDKWWVVPIHDVVHTPTADGAAYFALRRDRATFRRLVRESLQVHRQLYVGWPQLALQFRAAAPELGSPAQWKPLFAAAARPPLGARTGASDSFEMPSIPEQTPTMSEHADSAKQDDSATFERLVSRLSEAFPTTASVEISEVVSQSRQRFDGSTVRDYIPVLVERDARSALKTRSSHA